MFRRIRTLVALGALAAGAAVIPSAVSVAGTPPPTLRLVSVLHSTTVDRFPGEDLFFNLSTYLAAVNGPFEIQARRTPTGIDLTLIRRTASGDTRVIRHIPAGSGTTLERGLGKFFHLTWLTDTGSVVAQQDLPFCPATWAVTRIDDTGPMQPTYPFFCGGELTRATVLGVDRGWATQVLTDPVPDPGLPDGTYQLRIAIADNWANELRMPQPRSTDVQVTLQMFDDCSEGCPGSAARAASMRSDRQRQFRGQSTVPGPLPDLTPLPAWSISTSTATKHRDLLSFASTAANLGAGPMVVEGFRQGEEPEMPVTQYFISDGKPVGKVGVGFFHFDTRDGHHHWHFEDFAKYELVSVTNGGSVVSGKQSFCLAPTDAVDLTVPGAVWQPESVGLYSACGGEASVWIREVMPSGWGDTYFQDVAGQAFNITNVPNGDYLVRVTVNPAGNLHESDYGNNVSDVAVHLGGTPGHRTVQLLG